MCKTKALIFGINMPALKILIASTCMKTVPETFCFVRSISLQIGLSYATRYVAWGYLVKSVLDPAFKMLFGVNPNPNTAIFSIADGMQECQKVLIRVHMFKNCLMLYSIIHKSI